MLRPLTVALSVLLLAGCGAGDLLAPGNSETDRIARVVSDAIAWPRQESAMGYARAAAGTTAGQDGRLTVVEVTELVADDLEDPFGGLTFRVHVDGSEDGLISTDPVTACYQAEFGFYGVVTPPHRTRCPDAATAVQIPTPPPASPRTEIPDNTDTVLRAALSRAPAGPQPGLLEAKVAATLTHSSSLALAPDVTAAADGSDLGISVRADDGCVLGARTAGKVEVWSPSAVQLQPGELSCDPDTALAGWGQQAPH